MDFVIGLPGGFSISGTIALPKIEAKQEWYSNSLKQAMDYRTFV